MATDYSINASTQNCVLRLIIGPSPRKIELPAGYVLKAGQGVSLSDGKDAALFAYGPVMLHEALTAAELLQDKGFQLKVVNMPWLNRIDENWLTEVLGEISPIYVLEDHSPIGGLGDCLLNKLNKTGLINQRTFEKLAIEGYPAWGTPWEVLKYHRLDGASLADAIFKG